MANFTNYLSNTLNDAYKSGKLGAALFAITTPLLSFLTLRTKRKDICRVSEIKECITGATIYAANLGLLYALPMILDRESLFFKPCVALISSTLGTYGTAICTVYLLDKIDITKKHFLLTAALTSSISQANTTLSLIA